MARTAIVTGAGTGIGAASAAALARAGFSVALAGRRRGPLEEVAASVEAAGAAALVVPTDVTDADAVAALFGAVERRFGRLDLLFNNAGAGTAARPLEAVPLSDWRAVLDVNVTGTWLCTQHAIRLMKRQDPGGGRIVNNGSLSAHVPRMQGAAYTAAKHAISGLTKATALECRAAGIACGQLDVGNASTPMTAAMPEGVLQADGELRPEPRIAAEHVADALVYMARLPLEANVLSLTVMPTQMPYVGRG